ncbi:MAG: putative sensor domain DACNV-containing protein [Acidobacteriota bacterium]
MSDPAYPAARIVAKKVQAHFSRRLALARERGREALAPEPDAEAIETLIDAAFWASLRREEGLTPKISLALLPPEQAGQPLRFEQQLPLDPAALAKLAPAVERPGIHLGVWHETAADRVPGNLGTLRVWGTTRILPAYCFVIEVIASGLLVVKDRSEPIGKFINVAVLEGDQIKFVDERGVDVPDCPGMLRSLLGTDTSVPNGESVNVLVQLAASMRAHGRGGTLLVTPAGSSAWRESVASPVLYSVQPPFSELADLMRHDKDRGAAHEWQEDFRRAVDALAGLTAVDGATLVTDQYELLAFGAKITRRRGSPPVETVMVTEPVEGSTTSTAPPAQLGGTRHLSAAQFVHDQRDAVALVASQDGRFTIFKWSPCEDLVHAHRVEALLL